jgi:hypothetical protein
MEERRNCEKTLAVLCECGVSIAFADDVWRKTTSETSLPFRRHCLMYVILDKGVVSDWKFDSRAGGMRMSLKRKIWPSDGRKCVMVFEYTIDSKHKDQLGKFVHCTKYWVDPTLFH